MSARCRRSATVDAFVMTNKEPQLMLPSLTGIVRAVTLLCSIADVSECVMDALTNLTGHGQETVSGKLCIWLLSNLREIQVLKRHSI
jgi:hypothetical protein